MKKIIKIFFAVFMSVLIICFSCLTVFADTTVDNSYLTTDWLKKNVLTCSGFTLKNLPDDDYLVLALKTHNDSLNADSVRLIFIPKSARNFVNLGHRDSIYEGEMDNNCIYYYHTGVSDNNSYLHIQFLGVSYTCVKNPDGSLTPFTSVYNNNGGKYSKYAVFKGSMSTTEYFVCNNSDIVNFAVQQSGFQLVHLNMTTSKVSTIYNSNLFIQVTKIYPGYTGHIVDTTFEGVLAKFGKDCDNSILKQYKFQVYYLKNNDLVMMFLNNNKAPAYEVSDYVGQYDYSKKYKFTYANSYDAIIYFPQYEKYLTYDDWYNNKSEPNDFKWFWEEDKKSFSLISDWTVTFNDTGKPSYSGTRVVLSWDEKNSADNSSLVSSWETLDTEYLESKGFKKGRPDDQNYPYRVSYYINGVPKASVYFNSKPKLEVVRENDFNADYKMCLIPNFGYFYLELEDMYLPFDGTMGKYTNKSDFISNIQNGWYDFLTSCKADLDDDVWLHLFENYRGDDTYYIGSRVFFNWDVSAEIGKKPDDKFDYSKVFQNGGKYVDKNGHIHGGSLSNYDDEDLNKWNTNGKDDKSNKDTPNSSDFEFSFEGITEYCQEFWNFMQSALAIFPSFVWLLVFTSISVLIALRLLGR